MISSRLNLLELNSPRSRFPELTCVAHDIFLSVVLRYSNKLLRAEFSVVSVSAVNLKIKFNPLSV